MNYYKKKLPPIKLILCPKCKVDCPEEDVKKFGKCKVCIQYENKYKK